MLSDVSFSIGAGRTTALVGSTGSGKSTVARLLFRYYDPREGAVIIDGQDVRSLTQTSLRGAIGIVPQDAVLFNESIRYNIAYGRPGASEAEIIAAAKAAQIKTLGESQAAMAAAKAAREKEAADMTARAEKLKADMPAVTARMQELDGMIVKAATVVESSTAAVRSLEPEVAERQKQVDAAVGELSALQGLRPGT